MNDWENFFFSPFGLVMVALYGAMIGSFLNVVIHRLPRGDSPLLPRSRCPRCLMPIRPWTNVPVFGWLMLRGRCYDCRGAISGRYPLVEAACAALFVLSFTAFETPSLSRSLWASVICAWALVLALLDLDHRWLPDSLTLPMIPLGLIAQAWVGWASPRDALIGVALGAGLTLFASSLWQAWRHEPGLGYGDVKMMAALGAYFGWWGSLFVLLVAAAAAALVGTAWMVRGRLLPSARNHAAAHATLPFGAYLSFGAVVYLFGWLALNG